MNHLRYLFITFLALSFVSASAQDLTEEDKRAFEKRVKDKVEEFQGYLSTIVNTDVNINHRKAAMESALYLFMGNGEPYTVDVGSGRVENRRAVRMQVSSVTRGTKSWQSMKKYLSGQFNNNRKYAKVRIESADAVRVDNIYKVGKGKYECMAIFCQRYISYGADGRIAYGDISRKKVKVSITAIEMPDGSTIFEAKLGDVYVVSTERLGKR